MRVLLTTVGCLVLAGCDLHLWDTTHAASRTVVTNRFTGTVKVLDGTALVIAGAPLTPTDFVTAARTWPTKTIPQLGEVQVSVRTKHDGSAMKYIVAAEPYDKLDRDYLPLAAPSFIISFDDADGFTAHEFRVYLKGSDEGKLPTRIVDKEGKGSSLLWKGSIPMPKHSYESLSYLSVGWAGFPKARDEPKEK